MEGPDKYIKVSCRVIEALRECVEDIQHVAGRRTLLKRILMFCDDLDSIPVLRGNEQARNTGLHDEHAMDA
jgi:hypothetical protein